MSLLDEIRQDTKGGFVLADWLGHGGSPVPHDQAVERSQACLSGETDDKGAPRKCRFNKHSGWWKTAKGSIAQAIREMVQIKQRVNLSVPNEGELAMCSKCGCYLALKVHVPLAHIRKQLDTAAVSDYPSHCWIKKELLNGHL
jgi:hypothetical protein